MVFVALIAVVIALHKKAYRYLPVVCLAFLYGLANCIISFGIMGGTTLYNLFKALHAPSLIALMCLITWEFIKTREGTNKFKLPAVFCAALVVNKAVKSALFQINSWILILNGNEVSEGGWIYSFILILDIIHLCLGIGLVVSVIAYLNRIKTECAS